MGEDLLRVRPETPEGAREQLMLELSSLSQGLSDFNQMVTEPRVWNAYSCFVRNPNAEDLEARI